MTKKAPPEVLSPSDLAYMSTLNERDRRWFLATKAADLKAHGFSYRKVSKIMGTSTHTLQNGRQELLSGEGPGDGRIRRAGAGRKSVLPQHPEWTQAVVRIIEPHTAGLPDGVKYHRKRYEFFVRNIERVMNNEIPDCRINHLMR